ncbi:MAG: DUF6051 family protein [Tenuifilaceae bacterium]|jgi:hypothetical protein|nr:DUF6051 family protein [Tenuifilaceae bacterium]
MEFTKIFKELRQVFALNRDEIAIAGTSAMFRLMPFASHSNPIPFTRTGIYNGLNGHVYAAEDIAVVENVNFSYPVYIPNSSNKYSKAIILLHGLNERSWHKYLPWAQYLGNHTQRPVILFPIAFHMNRSPESWANPREMMPLINSRKIIEGISMTTFANIALSQRLSDDPLRFFTSGKQSADDLVQLLSSIKGGELPFLHKDSQLDFFSYSIGAFLAQILFLANPNELLSSSKLFIFSGGGLFSEMRGTSRLIMDSKAYSSLRKYYLHDFPIELKVKSPFSSFVKGGALGEAFLAMISSENNQFFREHKFQRMRDRIRVLALTKDTVIPAASAKEVFACVRNQKVVTELDFPYEYTHENPFPVFDNAKRLEVDRAFETVFSQAASFLN